MAVLPTLFPTSQITAGMWTDEAGGTTNLHLAIDESGAADTAYIRTPLDATGGAGDWGLTDTPSDFGTMVSIDIEIRHSRGSVEAGSAGAGDDTWTLRAELQAADLSLLTDVMTIESSSVGWAVKTEVVSFTGVVAGNKTIWDGAHLVLSCAYTRNMGADGHRVWVDFARIINGVYALAATTVTPDAIALSVVLPAPSIAAAATVTPAVIALTTVHPAATATVPATVTPAVIALAVVLDASTILAEATVAPAVIPAPAALPASSALAASTVTPAVIALSVAILDPATEWEVSDWSATVSATTFLTPAVIALSSTHPAVTIDTGGGATTVEPAVIALVVVLPASTVLAASTIEPAVIALASTHPAPTILAASTVEPAAIALVVVLPAPTILAASTVAPAVIVLVLTMPAPAVLAASLVAPAVIALAVVIPQAIPAIPALVTPAVIALVSVHPAVTVLVYAIAFMRPDADLALGGWDTAPTPGGELWENISKTAVDDNTWIEITV